MISNFWQPTKYIDICLLISHDLPQWPTLNTIVSPSESTDPPPPKKNNFADVHRETYAQN